MPGIDCDSDHRLLSVHIRITTPGQHPWGRSRPLDNLSRVPRLNVARLQNPDVAQAFNEAVFDLVRDDLASDLSLWQYAVRRAAEHVCGPSIRHRRPLWQVENSAALQKLAVTKQQAFLGLDGSASSFHHYRSVKKACRREVRVILNRWWSDRAAAIQLEVDTKTPNHQFAGFKELRQVFAPGHRPASKLKGRDGSLLRTRAERVTRWEGHFRDLLNVEARVDPTLLDSLASLPVYAPLANTPTFAEVLAAVSQLKRGKAHGPDGIQPELLMHLDHANLRVLHEFLCRMWEGLDPMPAEWKSNYLVPLPKSGDGTLRKYSTWETLMLHDLGYADDAGFIADTYEQLASWARALQAHYSTWGLSLSVAKTEALTTAAEGGRDPISMDAPEGAPSQIQFLFQYLGTQISQDGSCVSDISRRLDLARKAFWQLTANVWDVAQLALSTKPVRATAARGDKWFTKLLRGATLGLQKGRDQLAAQLERVAAVAVRASSDAGDARADLQLVFFLQGRIHTKALAALKDYPTGPAAIHSVGHLGKPREDAPWIAPVQFTGSSVGRRLRELWADPHLGCVFSKGPNGWPARVSPKRSASDAADARRSRARR
ncbi:unnamed protein product [Durusdinium trenchii]|uniref:RNA-directed DNA polymerase n=1 Tax=Durusdinium trenchii TaxID=1381693 RepID=A0ABP0LWW0_9DINO